MRFQSFSILGVFLLFIAFLSTYSCKKNDDWASPMVDYYISPVRDSFVISRVDNKTINLTYYDSSLLHIQSWKNIPLKYRNSFELSPDLKYPYIGYESFTMKGYLDTNVLTVILKSTPSIHVDSPTFFFDLKP